MFEWGRTPQWKQWICMLNRFGNVVWEPSNSCGVYSHHGDHVYRWLATSCLDKHDKASCSSIVAVSCWPKKPFDEIFSVASVLVCCEALKGIRRVLSRQEQYGSDSERCEPLVSHKAMACCVFIYKPSNATSVSNWRGLDPCLDIWAQGDRIPPNLTREVHNRCI